VKSRQAAKSVRPVSRIPLFHHGDTEKDDFDLERFISKFFSVFVASVSLANVAAADRQMPAITIEVTTNRTKGFLKYLIGMGTSGILLNIGFMIRILSFALQ
jgi:hypothetical protein